MPQELGLSSVRCMSGLDEIVEFLRGVRLETLSELDATSLAVIREL